LFARALWKIVRGEDSRKHLEQPPRYKNVAQDSPCNLAVLPFLFIKNSKSRNFKERKLRYVIKIGKLAGLLPLL
jgi:hypothetical protein